MSNKESKVSRRAVLTTGAVVAGAAAVTPFALNNKASMNKKPNIIFIMADDLGYADLGCYGARDIKTPHLDALARSGVRLTDGYSNSPVCSATRTALITGRYQYRYECGLEEPIGLVDIGLPENEPTLPSLMKDQGYRSVLVGKWHLGNTSAFGPLRSGYDRFFGIYDGGADYFSHNIRIGPDVTIGGLYEGKDPVKRHGYMTDILTDRSIKEVETASRDGVPLFLSLHFTAPHWPWEGPEDEALSKFVANSLHTDGGNLETYARMVENMDENIGRLVKKIEELGQTENTIIIFTSDNGGERFSDTWPFIGSKTELLEGGIRVPIIVKWPSKISAGTESEQAMISMDFLPTLLAATGYEKLDEVKSDGLNLLAILTGQEKPKGRELYWRYKYSNQSALRQGKWKYLSLAGKEYLFDIVEDQRERANLKDKEPERFAEMKAKYEAWNATMLPYSEDNYSHSISSLIADRYTAAPQFVPPPQK